MAQCRNILQNKYTVNTGLPNCEEFKASFLIKLGKLFAISILDPIGFCKKATI